MARLSGTTVLGPRIQPTVNYNYGSNRLLRLDLFFCFYKNNTNRTNVPELMCKIITFFQKINLIKDIVDSLEDERAGWLKQQANHKSYFPRWRKMRLTMGMYLFRKCDKGQQDEYSKHVRVT